mmetsp:Transcript_42695/g.106639  ORF Transcript_42695/g.106639 Transcript_42695/m.106639 type:complete len:127 (-) Transcript_42695:1564-1944(-)
MASRISCVGCVKVSDRRSITFIVSHSFPQQMGGFHGLSETCTVKTKWHGSHGKRPVRLLIPRARPPRKYSQQVRMCPCVPLKSVERQQAPSKAIKKMLRCATQSSSVAQEKTRRETKQEEARNRTV